MKHTSQLQALVHDVAAMRDAQRAVRRCEKSAEKQARIIEAREAERLVDIHIKMLQDQMQEQDLFATEEAEP